MSGKLVRFHGNETGENGYASEDDIIHRVKVLAEAFTFQEDHDTSKDEIWNEVSGVEGDVSEIRWDENSGEGAGLDDGPCSSRQSSGDTGDGHGRGRGRGRPGQRTIPGATVFVYHIPNYWDDDEL